MPIVCHNHGDNAPSASWEETPTFKAANKLAINQLINLQSVATRKFEQALDEIRTSYLHGVDELKDLLTKCTVNEFGIVNLDDPAGNTWHPDIVNLDDGQVRKKGNHDKSDDAVSKSNPSARLKKSLSFSESAHLRAAGDDLEGKRNGTSVVYVSEAAAEGLPTRSDSGVSYSLQELYSQTLELWPVFGQPLGQEAVAVDPSVGLMELQSKTRVKNMIAALQRTRVEVADVMARRSSIGTDGATKAMPRSMSMLYDTNSYLSCMTYFMVHPNSRKRILWDMLGGILIFFDVAVIPLESFDLSSAEKELRSIDWVTASYWTTSLVMSFFEGFENEGRVVMDPAMVATHHIKTWFAPDFVTCAIDWVLLGLGGSGAATRSWRINKAMRAARVLRFARLVRLVKISHFWNKFVDQVTSVWIRCLINVVSILFSVLLTTHYMGCYWYFVGNIWEGWYPQNWVKQAKMDDANFGKAYVASFHWAVAQSSYGTSVIAPTNEAEWLYATGVSCLWLIEISLAISFFTMWVLQAMDDSKDHRIQSTNLRNYLRNHNMSKQLRCDVLRFQRVQTGIRRLQEPDIPFLKELPVDLLVKVHETVYMPNICSLPVLRHIKAWQPVFLTHLSHVGMSEYFCSASELLFDEGQQAEYVYFVLDGKLEYYQAYTLGDGMGDNLEYVRHGETICEMTLWMPWKHCGRCSAAYSSEMVRLDACVFRNLVEEMARKPSGIEPLRTYARLFKEALSNMRPLSDICRHKVQANDLANRAFGGRVSEAKLSRTQFEQYVAKAKIMFGPSNTMARSQTSGQ